MISSNTNLNSIEQQPVCVGALTNLFSQISTKAPDLLNRIQRAIKPAVRPLPSPASTKNCIYLNQDTFLINPVFSYLGSKELRTICGISKRFFVISDQAKLNQINSLKVNRDAEIKIGDFWETEKKLLDFFVRKIGQGVSNGEKVNCLDLSRLGLEFSRIRSPVNFLDYCPNLTHLVLQNSEIAPIHFQVLLNANLNTLHTLNFKDSWFYAEEKDNEATIAQLAEFINRQSDLVSLNLSGFHRRDGNRTEFISFYIDSQGIERIAEGLKTKKKLQILNLSYTDCSSPFFSGITVLAAAIEQLPVLQIIHLSNIRCNNALLGKEVVDFGPLKPLMTVLSRLSHLQDLNFSANKTDSKDQQTQLLVETIKGNSELRILDLSHLFLGESQLEPLAEVLKRQSKLQELKLQGNGFVAMTSLVLAVKQIAGLLVLNLSQNKLGDQGAKELGGFLSKPTLLQELKLADCNITEIGAGALAKGIEGQKYFRKIDLSKNSIDYKGIYSLAVNLEKLADLQEVDLRENKNFRKEEAKLLLFCLMGQAGKNAIAKASVKQIQLVLNNLSHRVKTDEKTEILAQVVARLRVLKVMGTFYQTYLEQACKDYSPNY